MFPQPSYVTAADSQLALYRSDNPGIQAIMVPGASLVGRMLDPLAQATRPRFNSVLMDLRGHGGSRLLAKDNLNWNQFGSDVLTVIDALAMNSVVGIGHSAGASALILAELTRPGTFSALYLYEPIIVPMPGDLGTSPESLGLLDQITLELEQMSDRARHRRDHFESTDDAREHLGQRLPYKEMTPECFEAFINDGLIVRPNGTTDLACPGEREAQIYLSAAHTDAFSRLTSLACPVTIAYGSLSTGIPRLLVEPIATRIGVRCGLDELSRLDHFGPYVDPAKVARSILHAIDTAKA